MNRQEHIYKDWLSSCVGENIDLGVYFPTPKPYQTFKSEFMDIRHPLKRNRVEIHPIQNSSSMSQGTFCADSTLYCFDHYHMQRTMDLDRRVKDCILWKNNASAGGNGFPAEEKHLQL